MRFVPVLLLLAGCGASTSKAVKVDARAANVRLVMKEPDVERYKLVGKVDGVAPTDDLMLAAGAAEADIKNKAARMGAQLVKIDIINAPEDAGKKGVVVLEGRAFTERVETAPLAPRPNVRNNKNPSERGD
jgi:hypothetical protein